MTVHSHFKSLKTEVETEIKEIKEKIETGSDIGLITTTVNQLIATSIEDFETEQEDIRLLLPVLGLV